MTILSDEQIHELCVPPAKIHDQALYLKLMAQEPPRPRFEHMARTMEKHFEWEMKCRLESQRAPTEAELAEFIPMISPYEPELVRHIADQHEKMMGNAIVPIPVNLRRVISYGTSSYGYDIRLAEDVEIFTNIHSNTLDPKRFDPSKHLTKATVYTDEDGCKYVIMPPNGYLLGHTVEKFNIPRNITAVFIGKSTYARVGAIVNCTPGEAGWAGTLVVEISNSTPSPLRIYVNEGIAQALFFRGEKECKTSYADRGGKYMNQERITHAKV